MGEIQFDFQRATYTQDCSFPGVHSNMRDANYEILQVENTVLTDGGFYG